MTDALTPTPAMGKDEIAEVTRTTTGEMNSASPKSELSTSSSDNVDLEQQRSVNSSNDVIHDHVDIQYAEQQFAELKRRYSNLSRVNSTTSQKSRRGHGTVDHEKGGVGAGKEIDESEDEFDLEDVLRDRHKKEVEHDIKPKHLGTQLMERVDCRRNLREFDCPWIWRRQILNTDLSRRVC
jgi:hypothetical protein